MGNSYTVGIDDESGNRIYNYNSDVNLDTTTQYYTHIFEEGGNYSCYITNYNDYGFADSERIYFTIQCPHNYIEKVVAPTYLNVGYTEYTCLDCDKHYKDNYVPKKRGDGYLRISDAIAMQRYLSKNQTIVNDDIISLDVNEDEKFNVFDMIIIKRLLLENN